MKAVLIIGGQFGNQGAHLMLKAAADGVRDRFGVAPVVDLLLGTAAQKAKIGVGALWTPRLRRTGLQARSVPGLDRIARRLPVVLPRDVTAVLDISGFRYGDAWESLPLDRYAGYLEYWKHRGVPVYLMPQAFGPFQRTSAESLRALRAARIVMPRDQTSLSHVRELLQGDDAARVQPFRDFTITVKGSIPAAHQHLAGQVPVVANYNIADRSAGGSDSDGYVRTLAALANELRSQGHRPYGLLHGGERDRHILRQVADRVENFPLVEGMDGVGQKALIATAPIVITGRFHAAVSGLCQGIPTILHGWSHKYRWLADDYGVGEYVLDPVADLDGNLRALRTALADTSLRERLQERRGVMMQDTNDMWELLAEDWRSLCGLV